MAYDMVIKGINGNTLYKSTKRTIKDAIEEAINKGIYLSGADLSYADLRDTNLRYANLSDASLSGANLSYASLSCANLSNANLSNADLSGANISNAKLYNANLSNAKLRGAHLIYASLRDANLSGVDLSNADLSDADLRCAKNVPYIPMACPENGEFIGWKKIRFYEEYYNGIFIVKLLIPEDAKRCSATTNKCRCDKAKVLEIRNIITGKTVNFITNANKKRCVYKVGEMVYPDSFDEDRWNECSHGIHFFVNEEDALDY